MDLEMAGTSVRDKWIDSFEGRGTRNHHIHGHPQPYDTPPPGLLSSESFLVSTDHLIDGLLEKLNQGSRPYLTRSELRACYEEVKARLAPLLDIITYDTLVQALVPLREALTEAKLRVIQGRTAQQHLPASSRATIYPIMGTPTLERFLHETSRILREQNAYQLEDYLTVEPPFVGAYGDLVGELKRTYPKGQENALEVLCTSLLPEVRDGLDGSPWTAFLKFIVQYFGFIRDVDLGNLLEAYNLFSELLQKANSALGHLSSGKIILPTVAKYSRFLSSLAIRLDKQPELIAHLIKNSTDEAGIRETLPERAANIVRQAFVTCLNDRSGSPSGLTDGKPDGKKQGIYTLANVCLKILFQCQKTRNASQIFDNIYKQAPPLSAYPKAQRVTYLYYLGRFLWQNSHFYHAQMALQSAYDECMDDTSSMNPPGPKPRRRRLILIFLMASNIILGRFPSSSLYERPEAYGLRERFEPLCHAIANGDLCLFSKHLDFNGPYAGWFLKFCILLQLRNRCKVLVWRSLARKVFILSGFKGDGRKAPTLALQDLVCVSRYLERKALLPETDPKLDGGRPGYRNTNWSLYQKSPAPASIKRYVDPDFVGIPETADQSEDTLLLPDMLEIEAIVSSLIHQGLLRGFISHSQLRYAITGTKKAGSALAAGFPAPWEAITARADETVPGWKKEGDGGDDALGPGRVINISGARPAGAGP
ncbi:hypothetical protein LTR50_000776 [Elasticomyces elasticus]|nr:hypothetical protein LTR50_000776 [Elasticomyces elasticus]